MDATNFDAASGYFTFVLPGAPLTTNSSQDELTQARNTLQQQTQGQPFPIPPNMPVGLEVVFLYETRNDVPAVMDRQTIARELTLGILYDDNSDVCSKSVMGMPAPQGREPGTTIRVRVLEEGDMPQPDF